MNETLLQKNDCIVIRKNTHKTSMSPYYDIVWNDWEQSHSKLTTNIFYPILKKFVNGDDIVSVQIESCEHQYYISQENKTTLILKGLHSEDRKQVHLLCDNIGLQFSPHLTYEEWICCYPFSCGEWICCLTRI
jgi:hypothetical protein